MSTIWLYGTSPIADKLAAKLETLPVKLSRLRDPHLTPEPAYTDEYVDVVIVCERRRDSRQNWAQDPADELAAHMQYLTTAFSTVLARDVPHMILVGNVSEYPATLAVPYETDAMWEGWPDGDFRGVALRLMDAFVRARNAGGKLAHHIVLDSLYGDDTDYSDDAPFIPALIHRCTAAAHGGQDSVVINSDGTAQRTFLHIDDAVEGIIAVMNNGQHHPGTINHGGDQQIAVDKLAAIIKNFVGFTGEFMFDTSKSGGRPESLMDCDVLHHGIGFKPSKRLIAGIEAAVRQYQKTL